MRAIPLFIAMGLLTNAGAQGVSPRANLSDYQAHQSTKGAILAAAIVPTRQIEKMFSAEIARHYIVLEVAAYPQNGQPFDEQHVRDVMLLEVQTRTAVAGYLFGLSAGISESAVWRGFQRLALQATGSRCPWPKRVFPGEIKPL